MNKKTIITSMAVLQLFAGTINAQSNQGIVTATSLNVRSGPATSYTTKFIVNKGDNVTVEDSADGWYKITTKDGKNGWASSKYIQTSQNTTTTKVVSVSSLNMRSGPSTSYNIIEVLTKDTQVEVISVEDGWAKIKYNSKTGYVSNQYLSNSAPSSSSETSTTKYVVANVGLNVRKGPSTSHAVVTTLANGTKVTVKSTSNGWSKITTGNITGYVSSSYLTSKKPSSGSSSSSDSSTSTSASKLISYAKKFLGKPYVWGAQGPNGFDCSGFTYYVFKNSAGITLPRTSSMQSKYGTAVSKSNLKPGDLLFFDTVGSNNGGVTHCGIYIGNGQMIHAASGQGKVVINNINSSYYVNAYVNARRVL